MYEYIMRKEVVEDLKNLVEKVEEFDKYDIQKMLSGEYDEADAFEYLPYEFLE